tara:strand:- start:1616 stop:1882 length:267 start_codon:yes stop_codon:yes gene_type:complete
MNHEKRKDIDLVLCIAMFRCFNEQLYTLKGKDSKLAKQKFNRLIKLAKIYDDEIIKSSNNKDVDYIYDMLMDIIIEAKQQITLELKNE